MATRAKKTAEPTAPAAPRRKPTASDTAPEGVTTLSDATAPTGDPAPSNEGAKSVKLTAPSGSKVTVRSDLADKLKGAGYK